MVTEFRHHLPGTPAHSWRSHPRWKHAEPVDLAGIDRLVVLAAHPDDESLGAGGLIATAAAAGIVVDLIAVTAGEHSHPASPTHTPAELGEIRREESARAIAAMAPETVTTWLDVEDGHVRASTDVVVRAVVALVGDGASTLVVAPWRGDGHTDHAATGEAASIAAYRCGARLLEYPVWWWHWGDPEEGWPPLVLLRLSDDAVARKQSAIAAHASQVRPLSRRPGDEALLGPGLLEHFEGGEEMFVSERPADPTLDGLHLRERDPWGVEDRWYEKRKRQLSLAALPRARFERAIEFGCSIGALTAELSTRCEHLIAVDNSAAALREARRRPLGDHVDLRQIDLLAGPFEEAVGGWFDLIVVSEVGYFLSPAALRELVAWTDRALTPAGVLMLCHWRHPVDGWPLDGPTVHASFRQAAPRPVQTTLRETDFEILILAGKASWPIAAERGVQ